MSIEPKWSLCMSLIGPYGERLSYVIDLDERTASDLYRIKPLDTSLAAFGIGPTFEQAVEVLKRKRFRSDLFRQEAARLGALLAERMEDAEGWHDESRIEPARKQIG